MPRLIQSKTFPDETRCTWLFVLFLPINEEDLGYAVRFPAGNQQFASPGEKMPVFFPVPLACTIINVWHGIRRIFRAESLISSLVLLWSETSAFRPSSPHPALKGGVSMRAVAWEGSQTPPKRKTQSPEGLCYRIAPACDGMWAIALEVRDWMAGQIVEADPKTAILQIAAERQQRKMPLAQAPQYVNSLLSQLGRCKDDSRGNKNSLACPVAWGAAFPHMRRNEFEAGGPGKVIVAGYTEDLDSCRKFCIYV